MSSKHQWERLELFKSLKDCSIRFFFRAKVQITEGIKIKGTKKLDHFQNTGHIEEVQPAATRGISRFFHQTIRNQDIKLYQIGHGCSKKILKNLVDTLGSVHLLMTHKL